MSIPSCTAAREGMTQSQEGHMRAPFKQRNISSTSLEGMERPVRSFKSFIQTAPPNPTDTDKALPLTPPPRIRADSYGEKAPTPPSSGFSPTPRERNESIASWKAPAEWYNDSASGKSMHTPSPPLTPPTSAPRTFSPLLPEPSPGLLGVAETTAWMSYSPSASRLLPIYERTNGTPDLGPPKSPPTSPLPATPLSNNRSVEKRVPPEHRRANSSPSRKAIGADARVHIISQSESTKAKAYASLGIDSPLSNKAYNSSSGQRVRERADCEYLKGKKLRALYKGSPLVDDSWEDEDMDEKTREMSFSQDYHDLLADQYQEMNVRAEEVLSSGGRQQVYEAQLAEKMQTSLPNDRDIIPGPLSWRKSSNPSTPRDHSQDRTAEQPSRAGQKSRHKRLSSFIPHRLGTFEHSKDGNSRNEHRPSNSEHKLESDVDETREYDLRFSKFFPSSRPIKFGKKQKKVAVAKAPSTPSSPPRPSPLIRLPGGLAVVRTHSPSPMPKSDVLSDKSPTSTHTRGSSQYGSDYSHSTSDPRSSYHSQTSPSTANIPIAMRSAYRTSGGSSHSYRSSTGRPLADEVSPPPPPPLPPVVPGSPPQPPPPSPETLGRFQSPEKHADNRYKPNFIEKARDARRRRLTEARQDRLKKSIKVLGPTDPGVAQAGYVKSGEGLEQSDSDLERRLPGYMVGGSA